jgi:hypothetical protein
MILSFFIAKNKSVASRKEIIEYITDKTDNTTCENLQISLEHNHLPKLSECGLISREKNKVKYYKYKSVENMVESMNDFSI